jgi:hypothetical protein
MNRGVLCASPKHTIAQSLWNGQAILGTDSSVHDNIATYSWVLSTTNKTIGPDVKGGGFLPPSAVHTGHYPTEPIMESINLAFNSQLRIGWDQFFRGHISSAWKHTICLYYTDRKPGVSFTPDCWTRTTIDAIWKFAMTLWRHRCTTYHGENSVLTKEQCQKETLTSATMIYNDTICCPSDRLILHQAKITEILNWTKQYLDTYLAIAEVICKWNIKPR